MAESVSFGVWPPTAKGANEGVATGAKEQANVRTLAAVGIAQDGTIGTDPLGVVESVTLNPAGTFLIALKFTPGPNTTVTATLAGVTGEIDAAASGSGVLVHTRADDGTLASKPFYLQVVG